MAWSKGFLESVMVEKLLEINLCRCFFIKSFSSYPFKEMAVLAGFIGK
jgi:hypothetical protein